jgi:hypothetical protein
MHFPITQIQIKPLPFQHANNINLNEPYQSNHCVHSHLNFKSMQHSTANTTDLSPRKLATLSITRATEEAEDILSSCHIQAAERLA